MDNQDRGADTKKPSRAEIAASVEAIGHLHHMLRGINGSLAIARNAARALLAHSHALPGGVPEQAAIAVSRLRLELAHSETLSLETLRAVVDTIPVPEVSLSTETQNCS